MGFFQLLIYIFLFIWIKYITRHFKTQIDEKKICPWVGLEPTKVLYISRAEIEKFFIRFLVQVKIAKSPLEINWHLRQLLQYWKKSWRLPIFTSRWKLIDQGQSLSLTFNRECTNRVKKFMKDRSTNKIDLLQCNWLEIP